jgi:hypothetical protein
LAYGSDMGLISEPSCLYFIILLFLIFFDSTEEQNAVNWFENLPAVAMDYKVHIDPGKEDCYFQYVNPGATFYVSFQVSDCFILQLSLSNVYLKLNEI